MTYRYSLKACRHCGSEKLREFCPETTDYLDSCSPYTRQELKAELSRLNKHIEAVKEALQEGAI